MHRLTTAGIDIGSSAIKVAVVDEEADGQITVRSAVSERIRRRAPAQVLGLIFERALAEARVGAASDLCYIASTGEGDVAQGLRTGHFYGMTSHARGGLILEPRARTVLDVGALYARAIQVDEHAKVLSYRMTSQCAAGTGQFVENIARYLGVRLDEVGDISNAAQRAEPVSGICAVLAETDVINMVSRGIATGEILRGIHESIAQQLAKLLRAARGKGPVLMTGGLAADAGLRAALTRRLGEDDKAPEILSHPKSLYAGAIGAAAWGAFRHRKLERSAPIDQEAGLA